MNKVILIGRVTKSIELKTTTNGTSVASFNLAVNRNFKNAQGEKETDFFTCISFNKLAETISKYVGKGDQVMVGGRLQTRNYTNKDGHTVYVTEIMVEEVEFLQNKREQPKQELTEVTDPFDTLPFDDELPL